MTGMGFSSKSELPASAERSVEADQGHELVALDAHELDLRREELLLRFQHLEVARDAVAITLQRKLNRNAELLDRLGALGPHVAEALARDEQVRDLRERGQRGLLVALDGCVERRALTAVLREQPAALEN